MPVQRGKGFRLEDLSPQTDYIVYFVIQNTAQNYSEVQCYRFTTTDVGTPYITLNNQSRMYNLNLGELGAELCSGGI